MQAEIVSRKENPLLKRIELQFKIVHHGEGTPTRDTVREEVAKLAKAPKERVIIDHMNSQFGKLETLGYAKVYDSKEDALEIERKYVLGRNKLIELEKKKKVKKVGAYKPEEEEPEPEAEKAESEQEPEAPKEEAKEKTETKEKGD
ncbi:MAG: 30S ribosomal protein S24e [Methanomassiliicoccales archaeon]|nr:MAG: 30S ribosomal protein S24e [Methanomassiliicoccales archaeon]